MRRRSPRRVAARIGAALLCAPGWAPGPARAADVLPGMSDTAIDALVEATRRTFHVPGIALGIVQDGRVIFARGYGVRETGHPEPVDVHTRFAIGSNTKAFTTAALALLDHEHRLAWDDPVWQHMPEFALADPAITRAFTVTDLLTHHSGMAAGAGDLMLFSRARFGRAEAVSHLRDMPFDGGFRSRYGYNNLLYVAAGRLIEESSGLSWERFVQTRLIDAAGLPDCTAAPAPPRPGENRATGHGIVDDHAAPHAVAVPWEELPAAGPAGGVFCSLAGMQGWAAMLLDRGRAQGRAVLPPDEIDTLWAPHAILPLPGTAALTQTHFRTYGLGWFVEDFYGARRVFHTGTIENMVSYVSLLPERHLGIVVLTNLDDHHATYTLAMSLSAAALGHREMDWLAEYRRQAAASAAKARASEARAPGSAARPWIALDPARMAEYVGTYRDRWRGDATITRRGDGLAFALSRADGLVGTLSPLPHDLFVVRWDDRVRDGGDDAYVQVHRGVDGRIRALTMQLLGSDFSFDVQDLNLVRVDR